MLHRQQALKLLLVVVNLRLDPKSGTKCAGTITKKVSKTNTISIEID